jgi:sulfate transport system ATP-binding protein
MTIILDNITKRLQNNLIVNHVSTQINNGELFVLLGSSGSGKSTILRLIAGLTTPDTGRIILHDKDVTRLPPQKRGIGFVFQNYAIFPHMNVRENVEYGLKVRKIATQIRRQKSDELLEIVGLAGLGSRMPAQLSGGQRQRVALARALAYQPEVLLLDEPFGALDLKIRSQLRRSLKDVQRQLNVTAILVTHDQEEAFELGDRIGVLEKGRLLEVGSPQDLYHHPKNEFVASFIGGGNVIVGKAVKQKIRIGSTTLDFPKDYNHYEEGAPVRVMFRPESVCLASSKDNLKNSFAYLGEGEILETNFAGANTKLRIGIRNIKDIRPVASNLNYDTNQVNILANLLSNEEAYFYQVGKNCHIGITKFHVLNSKNMHFMLFNGWSKDNKAVHNLTTQLTLASHGHLTYLDIDSGLSKVHEINRTTAEDLKLDAAHFDLIHRKGSIIRELLDSIQTQQPDMLIIGLPNEITEEISRTLVFNTAKILRYTRIPVMLIPSKASIINKVLICTAGGEPGKSDILFGARLARHIKAHVTTLQVVPNSSSTEVITRAEKYLAKADALLDTYDLEHDIKVVKGNPLEQISKVANDFNHNLVVLGASAERRLSTSIGKLLATSLLETGKHSVLIVPELS